MQSSQSVAKDRDIQSRKIILAGIAVCVAVVALAIIIFVAVSQPKHPDSVNDVFGIQSSGEIKKAIPVQNVTTSSAGNNFQNVNGKDMAQDTSALEKLYQILGKAELANGNIQAIFLKRRAEPLSSANRRHSS